MSHLPVAGNDLNSNRSNTVTGKSVSQSVSALVSGENTQEVDYCEK